MIQAILLTNNEVIISQFIPEVDEDNEPYFALMYPYLFSLDDSSKSGFKLTPWLNAVTESTEKFIVYPNKIVTMKDPKPSIIKQYKMLVLFDEDKLIEDKKETDYIEPNIVEDQLTLSPTVDDEEEDVEIYEEDDE